MSKLNTNGDEIITYTLTFFILLGPFWGPYLCCHSLLKDGKTDDLKHCALFLTALSEPRYEFYFYINTLQC